MYPLPVLSRLSCGVKIDHPETSLLLEESAVFGGNGTGRELKFAGLSSTHNGQAAVQVRLADDFPVRSADNHRVGSLYRCAHKMVVGD